MKGVSEKIVLVENGIGEGLAEHQTHACVSSFVTIPFPFINEININFERWWYLRPARPRRLLIKQMNF